MVDNRKITMGSMSTPYNVDPKLLMKNESADNSLCSLPTNHCKNAKKTSWRAQIKCRHLIRSIIFWASITTLVLLRWYNCASITARQYYRVSGPIVPGIEILAIPELDLNHSITKILSNDISTNVNYSTNQSHSLSNWNICHDSSSEIRNTFLSTSLCQSQ